MSLIAELKRRNVVRVGLAYCVIGWIVAQVAELSLGAFGAPAWALKTVVVLLLLGLPIALVVAWAFVLTPEGIRREVSIDGPRPKSRLTGRALDFVIIAALAVALAYFAWDRQAAVDRSGPTGDAITEQLTGAPARRSIAVLPFVDISPNRNQDWFADGLTEEILNALARTPDLLVAARTSSFKYKGSNEDVPTIARELGVAHILEGSVRTGRDRLRVTAQLVRANDGFHLWSQNYDRPPNEVIHLQEEIAIEIATALKTALNPDELARMVSSGTSSVDAYNAYLKGLAYDASTVDTGNPMEFLNARDAFERAIELDPQFALAYWELAKFWEAQMQGTNIVAGYIDSSREEMLASFMAAIDGAIQHERDPVSVIQYRVLRNAENLRFDQALRLNTEYLERRPNDQRAQRFQLDYLAYMSMDEALVDAIDEYLQHNAYDIDLTAMAMVHSLVSDDMGFIRRIASMALGRLGNNPFIIYQAHRSFLWVGDTDTASRLGQRLRSSDFPDEVRQLVALRQACAEDKVEVAERIYETIRSGYPEDRSVLWNAHLVMSRHEAAVATLIDLDERGDLGTLSDYVGYAYFDARPFANLMTLLESLGVTPREPREIPYRCRT